MPDLAIAQQDAGQDRAQHADDLVLHRIGLALGRVARGNVANFVAQHPGQFRLVVHQRNQLPRGVDIASRNGEGIVDRGIEQGNGKIALRVRQAGLDGNLAPDSGHVIGLGPLHCPAEFLQQLRMVFRAFLLVLRADRLDRTG